ncbi:serine/threonine-protein phosphatase [Pseudoclavibacter chungangensis]|uniref:Serine/threonine-protein phosphatase n=1 Tax=Pseudoclavibacter chungangensis TaxID=587635 RepID=A0A7J5BPV0_9MICO|nr:PP2C family serine/threonine-protein phosphatase [Pseudoclavibacter chungangensis]KAB1655340.1 serine/threonine-protein phosphatase [Pseudoclavibacter chungangensis]NYJ68288.1 protein phosphatase [Pseudoclavibacter chungangensis]
MTIIARASAVSHVGRVRSNNQDSAFVGEHVFLVADGMGGHAGGDVASAIVAKYVAENDVAFPTTDDAENGLARLLVEGNRQIADAVDEHPELRGMGTTSDAISLVGDKLVLAHIGDSRVYRFHESELTQETVDHTFVQRLVDAGRITPEEALVHPRRSVLMRVLGDVETEPEIDTFVTDAVIGDRWLLCSDGLSSYVDESRIAATLRNSVSLSSREVADELVQLALDNGAPDNVTVVVLEIGDTQLEPLEPKLVGSAANPLRYASKRQRRQSQLIPNLLHPLRRAGSRPEDEEFVPPTDEFLDRLIADDRKRRRVRQVSWLVGILLFVSALAGAGALSYAWTQEQYFVAESDGYVAIYQGVQQPLGPIELSHVVEVTDIPVNHIADYQRGQVEVGITATSLEDARDVVERLRSAVDA